MLQFDLYLLSKIFLCPLIFNAKIGEERLKWRVFLSAKIDSVLSSSIKIKKIKKLKCV